MRPNKSFKLSQLLTKIKRKSIAFTGQDEFDKISQTLAIIFQVYRIIDANSYENVCIVNSSIHFCDRTCAKRCFISSKRLADIFSVV